MPVFESTSSDIYDPDRSEDPFSSPNVSNRHRTLVETISYISILDYLLLFIQSEALLEQLRALQAIRDAIHGWISSNATRATLPVTLERGSGMDSAPEVEPSYTSGGDFQPDETSNEGSFESDDDFTESEAEEEADETEQADLKPTMTVEDTERSVELEI
jgi:hypothetical protein